MCLNQLVSYNISRAFIIDVLSFSLSLSFFLFLFLSNKHENRLLSFSAICFDSVSNTLFGSTTVVEQCVSCIGRHYRAKARSSLLFILFIDIIKRYIFLITTTASSTFIFILISTSTPCSDIQRTTYNLSAANNSTSSYSEHIQRNSCSTYYIAKALC